MSGGIWWRSNPENEQLDVLDDKINYNVDPHRILP